MVKFMDDGTYGQGIAINITHIYIHIDDQYMCIYTTKQTKAFKKLVGANKKLIKYKAIK